MSKQIGGYSDRDRGYPSSWRYCGGGASDALSDDE